MTVIEIPEIAVVTVPNVPFLATGIEYKLSSGPATFTVEDLAEVIASQEDPAIRSPRQGIGHIDPRYNGAPYDGTPAFGVYKNLRLAENGNLLVADIVGVPVWLARLMPIAFPNRSIEGNYGAETVTGHTWRLIVEAVKLLGVLWPGCSVLEDLPLYYGETMPDDVVVIEKEGEAGVNAKVAAARGRAPVEASVNIDDIRRQYYEELDAAQMWWWIRSMYQEPNELIVEDDEGSLYRVPYEIRDEDITFSDAVQVRIRYVDAARGSGRRPIALVASAGRVVAEYDSRAASRPDDNQEGKTVDPVILRSLRAHHRLSEEDLPDDATESQISAAIAASEEGAQPPGGTPAGEPETTDDEPEADEEETEDGGEDREETGDVSEAANRAVASGSRMVSVPQAEWARTQAALQRLTDKDERNERAGRIQILEAAIGDGKVRPADRASYLNGLENPASRDQYVSLLTASVDEGGLARGIVPVSERGNGGAAPGEELAASDAGYDDSWLSPSERAHVAAVRGGEFSHGTITIQKGA